MYGKSECMKIIIGCNHFYGGYCLKRDFKGILSILRYFRSLRVFNDFKGFKGI